MWPGNRASASVSAVRCLRRGDRGRATPAADIEHPFAGQDRGGAEQVRRQVLVLGQALLSIALSWRPYLVPAATCLQLWVRLVRTCLGLTTTVMSFRRLASAILIWRQ